LKLRFNVYIHNTFKEKVLFILHTLSLTKMTNSFVMGHYFGVTLEVFLTSLDVRKTPRGSNGMCEASIALYIQT